MVFFPKCESSVARVPLRETNYLTHFIGDFSKLFNSLICFWALVLVEYFALTSPVFSLITLYRFVFTIFSI